MIVYLGPFAYSLAMIRYDAAIGQEVATSGKLKKTVRGRSYAPDHTGRW
jgi:hypothetical protein